LAAGQLQIYLTLPYYTFNGQPLPWRNGILVELHSLGR